MLRTALITTITTVVSLHTTAQNPKEAAFRSTLQTVVQKIINKDSVGLAKYIDKNTGIYLLHKIGITQTYTRYATIGFRDSTYPRILFNTNLKKVPSLQFARLPENDCEKWNKKGSFVDTSLTDHLLTKIVLEIKRNTGSQISQKELGEMTILESKSRRVVIVQDDMRWLIIYLSYINNKWVLTIYDQATGDCSV
jgi:hypothetical protein